ncbi:MAG: DUF5777 family beta-barrel protein [Acidobacteriia bacterium]|nr:DUF5777 family beta-barrel protein [Terriglobia bacterium]
MTRRYLSLVLITSFALLLTTTPARAQTSSDPAASPTNAVQTPSAQADDDDAKLRPIEPDFNVINLPTTLPLPEHAGDFHLMHRFAGNLRQGSFGDNLGNLFGIDQGATMSFEYRFGVMKHLEAIAARTNFDKNVQFSTKYDAFHQDATHPVGLSAILSVEGGNNFRRDYAPAIGASISRTYQDKIAVYADPFWVHNSAAATGVDENTGFVGLGARTRIVKDTFFVFEVTPRLGGYTPADAEFAFSVEKRVGGHVFSLVFGNSPDSTYGQLARGGFPQSLFLGFNLARKFF